MKQLEKKNTFSGIFNKPQAAKMAPTTTKNKEENKNMNHDENINEKKEKEKESKNMENLEKKTNIPNMNYNLSYEVNPNAKIPNEINELGK